MGLKVLGIDPGLADTGVGIVHGTSRHVEGYAFGTVRTTAREADSARLVHIYERVSGIVREQSPDLVVVEESFSLARYPKSGIQLGKVTGAILVACGHCGMPVREVPVRVVKQVLTGNGRAGKAQVEAAVRRELGRTEPIRPSHASDALALALIGLYRGMETLLNESRPAPRETR
ncbi:MAG: crossover junction endodeoxyribonuclease RuvC [Desulfatibacillaceae bacterium]